MQPGQSVAQKLIRYTLPRSSWVDIFSPEIETILKSFIFFLTILNETIPIKMSPINTGKIFFAILSNPIAQRRYNSGLKEVYIKILKVNL